MANLFQHLWLITRLYKPINRLFTQNQSKVSQRIIHRGNWFKQERISRVLRLSFGKYQRSLWLLLAVVCLPLLVNWSFHGSTDVANAAMTIQPPLSTQGSNIVDAIGKPVLLRGVNWFGLETESHAPHGLWVRDYKEMLAQIKSLGYNVIRLPYSVQSLRAANASGIDFTHGKNQDLQGKTPLQVMDLIIQEAQRQGLLILLDSHRLNDQWIPSLWYGDGFTEADWIDTWKMLATRYKNRTNVIGADLKNEPHGDSSWGTNNPATDWRLAAERAGNAILALNPNWLIVVEGVEDHVPGQQLLHHWQGGNLEGVRRYPVRLAVPHHLVYSAHEYGPGVYPQPWFAAASFPQNLDERWETSFNYIATNKIAPVLIGEFGGRRVDKSQEGIWQRQLINYIQQKRLSFTYWSWNPDSANTGGILQDDWQSVNVEKQEQLSPLLLMSYGHSGDPVTQGRGHGNISASSIQPSSSTATQLQAVANIQSDWQSGFCVGLQVINQGNTSVRNWELTFQMAQAAINQSWNGNFQPQNRANGLPIQYAVTPLDWGRTIAPHQTRDLGFCANKLGSNYRPTQVKVVSY